MELISNSRFITIINNIDGSIIDRIELNDVFYDNLNLFLEKYKGSNEDYAKLTCNNIPINSINIFKVNNDFIMPDDTDIIYMVKSYKKYVYIKKVNGEYRLIHDEEPYYDKYYYILFSLPNIITEEHIIKYNRRELILFSLREIYNKWYVESRFEFILQLICDMIYPHEYDDYDFMLAVCKYSMHLYLYASEKLKDNKEFMLNVITQNVYILEYANTTIKNNYDIVLAGVTINGNILQYVSKELKDNYNIVLAAITINGYVLKYASDNLRDNYNIVLAAINNYSFALKYASDNMRNNYNIVLTAVKQCGMTLYYASANMRNNYNIVLTAVKQNGMILQYVSKRLRDNYDIVLVAANQCNKSIMYASKRLKEIIKI